MKTARLAPALLALLAHAASAAPVALRYRPLAEPVRYRLEERQQETLLGGAAPVALRDDAFATAIERHQRAGAGDELLVLVRARPVAARMGEERLPMDEARQELARDSRFRMDPRGQRPDQWHPWTPIFPTEAIEPGTRWRQAVMTPEGAALELVCELVRVEAGEAGPEALLRFVTRDQGDDQKWRIQGTWRFDLRRGVLLEAETQLDVIARFEAPRPGAPDRFRRRTVRKLVARSPQPPAVD